MIVAEHTPSLRLIMCVCVVTERDDKESMLKISVESANARHKSS